MAMHSADSLESEGLRPVGQRGGDRFGALPRSRCIWAGRRRATGCSRCCRSHSSRFPSGPCGRGVQPACEVPARRRSAGRTAAGRRRSRATPRRSCRSACRSPAAARRCRRPEASPAPVLPGSRGAPGSPRRPRGCCSREPMYRPCSEASVASSGRLGDEVAPQLADEERGVQRVRDAQPHGVVPSPSCRSARTRSCVPVSWREASKWKFCRPLLSVHSAVQPVRVPRHFADVVLGVRAAVGAEGEQLHHLPRVVLVRFLTCRCRSRRGTPASPGSS